MATGDKVSRCQQGKQISHFGTSRKLEKGVTTMIEKDFEVLAESISKLLPERGYDSHEIAGIVADSLGKTNPDFDRERFLAASRHAEHQVDPSDI